MTWWWDRFEAVIQQDIRDDRGSYAAAERIETTGDFGLAQSLASQGQVAATDPPRRALWEAALYQRMHIDGLRAVLADPLQKWIVQPRERSVGIIDLGCGAGTVACAFGELLGPRARLHYVGHDHHKPSLDLCRRMIGDRIAHNGGELHLTRSIREAFEYAHRNWRGLDRAYVTCSYLLCQKTFTDEIFSEMTDRIALLVRDGNVGRGGVRVVISDASYWKSRAPEVAPALTAKQLTVNSLHREARIFQYTIQYPALRSRTIRNSFPGRVEGYYLVVTESSHG